MRRALAPTMAVALATAFLVAQAMSTSPAAAPAPPGEPAFMISAPGKVEGERRTDRFVAHGVTPACEGVLFKGKLEGRSAELPLSSENYGCIANVLSGLPADFFTDYACDYVLHDLEPTGGAERWETDVDIDCPGRYTGFAFEIYETFEELAQVCAIWFAEQGDVGTATVRNLGGRRGGIEVRWDLRFEYELSTPDGSGSSLLCGSLPGSTGADAAYTGAATVFAHDRQGNPLRLWVAG